MSSGPVVAMCWEGLGAVKTGRVMLGETNPKDSKPGTIRGDLCIEVNLDLRPLQLKLWIPLNNLRNYNYTFVNLCL